MTEADRRPTALAGLEQAVTHLPEMVLAMTRMQATVLDAAIRQNIEWVDFLKARLERDRALVAHIARAADAEEATRLWSDFWKTATEDYAAEPRRLSRIAQSALNSALSEARRDADDLTRPAHSTAL